MGVKLLFINLLPKQLKLVISSKNFKEIPRYILMNGRNQTKFIYWSMFSLLIVFQGSHSFQSYFMKTDGPEHKGR